jgi:hypothetical protein
MIQLQRFVFDTTKDRTIKLKDRVTFNHKLDMWPYMALDARHSLNQSDCQFELKGVITHIGNTANRGHYISFVKHDQAIADNTGETPNWREFNDAVVNGFDPDDKHNGANTRWFGRTKEENKTDSANNEHAYLLVYHQCTPQTSKALRQLHPQQLNNDLNTEVHETRNFKTCIVSHSPIDFFQCCIIYI